MYKSLKLLQFKDIYWLFLLKFIHFILYKIPPVFDTFYVELLPDHNYPKRNTRINLPMVRLDIGKNALLFQSCKLINDIQECFLIPQSSQTLTKNFKSHCIENY